MTPTGTDYRINLDAKFDLGEAGEACKTKDVAAFETEYEKRAAQFARDHGITLAVVDGNETDNGDEERVWQEIHNMCQSAD